ncbi:MAG: hypothetical protein KJ927_06030, partial [Candidatus Eisenbacteria bacterium]|nr:hypothetical protein [Candidatus Eisenbacteria bacterium]
SCARETPTEEGQGQWRLQWEAIPQDSLTLGDPFHIRLSGALPAGSRLLASPFESVPAPFALRKGSAPKERNLGDSLTYYSQSVELAAFEPGHHRLGPLPVAYLLGADSLLLWSDTLAISIARVINDSQQVADLRDIKPPLPMKRSRLLWIVMGGVLLLAAAAAYYLLRRRRGQMGTLARPALPPLEEFDLGLVKLQADRFPEKGEWGLYTLRLSWLVRRYMERRYQKPILEMTTAEIRRWTRQEAFDLKLGNRLLNWLGVGDQIKFAGAVPTLAECGNLMNEGREIVHRIHESTLSDAESDGLKGDGAASAAGKEG